MNTKYLYIKAAMLINHGILLNLRQINRIEGLVQINPSINRVKKYVFFRFVCLRVLGLKGTKFTIGKKRGETSSLRTLLSAQKLQVGDLVGYHLL